MKYFTLSEVSVSLTFVSRSNLQQSQVGFSAKLSEVKGFSKKTKFLNKVNRIQKAFIVLQDSRVTDEGLISIAGRVGNIEISRQRSAFISPY